MRLGFGKNSGKLHVPFNHYPPQYRSLWVRKIVMLLIHDYITFRNSLIPKNSRDHLHVCAPYDVMNEQDSIDQKIVKR